MRSMRLRRRLVLSTALGTGLLLAAPRARGQDTARLPNAADVLTSAGIGAPVLSLGDTRLDVGVTSNGATVDWKQFDIPVGQSIHFNDETGGGGTPVAVLNRVIGNGGTVKASTIDGLLQAPSNMAVFLINSAGITFGPTGAVNVGSLIASTLDLQPETFLTQVEAGRYTFAGTGAGGVQVDAGARLFATGSSAAGLGDLVLLGAKVVVGPVATGTTATILARSGIDPDAPTVLAPSADDGDVALVAADDVTIEMGTGSPLSITIAKGTAVEGAFKVDGSIAGRNVTLALATRGGVTDTLLSVAGMTTATGVAVTDRGVVLTAGRDVAGVTLSSALPLADPADIDPVGAITTTATIGSGRALAVAAAGAATLGGGITTGGDLVVDAAGITLGTAATTVSQAATGKVDLIARTGDIRSLGTLRLGANRSDVAYDPATPVDRGLYLDAVGGAIDLTGSSLTTGSTPATGYAVQIRNDADNPASIRGVTLGDITAHGLTIADASHTLSRDTVIDVTGGLTLGTARLTAATITATGNIAAAGLNVDGATSLVSGAGGVTLGGLTTLAGNASLNASGIVTVTGAVDIVGNYAVTGRSVSLGTGGTATTQGASGAVTITATGGTLSGLAGLTLRSGPAGALTLATTGSIAGDVAFAGTTLIAGDTTDRPAVQIRSRDADNTVTLGTVRAGNLLGAIADNSFATGIVRNAAITVGDVTLAGAPTGTDTTLRLDAGIAALTTGTLIAPTITLGAGDLSLGRITGTGAVTLTGAGALTAGSIAGITGLTVDRGGSVTLSDVTASGDILIGQTATARPVTITTTGTLTSTTGAIRLTSSGAQALGGTIGARGAAMFDGGSIVAGTVTSTTAMVQANATGAITLASATSAGDTIVDAGGIARITGVVSSGAGYRVTGSGVVLGNGTTPVTQAANGSVRLISTTGTIAGGAGLTLQGDRAATGIGTLVLDGAGGIAFDPTTVLRGGTGTTGDIGVRTGAGAGIALGIVAARRLTGADTARALTASLAASGTLDLTGTVTTVRTLEASAASTLTTQAITVTGANQDLILTTTGTSADITARGLLTAPRDLRLTAARNLDFTTAIAGAAATATATTGTLTGTTLAGGTAAAVAGGALSLTTLTGQSGALARGTDITLGSAETITGPLSLTATTSDLIATRAVSGGAVTLLAGNSIELGLGQAGGDLTIVDALGVGGIGGTRTALSAGRDLTVTARGAVRGTTFTAARDLTVTAGSINLLTGTATGGSARLTTTGDTVLGKVDTEGNLTIDVQGALRTTSLTAAGTIAARGASATIGRTTGNIVALTAATGDLTLTEVTGASGVDLIAAGDTHAGNVTATGATADLSIATSNLDGGIGVRSILTAGRDLTLTARGTVLAGPVGAGRQATLSAASLDLSTMTAAGAAITAIAGDAIAASLTTVGTLDYTASGIARIDTIDAGGFATITGGAVDLGMVRGRDGVRATSLDTTLQIDDLSASRDIFLGAATDAGLGRIVSTDGSLGITAGGALGATTLTTATAITGAGATVTIGSITAHTIDLATGTGLLDVTTARASDALTLTSGADLRLADGIADGAATLTATGTARVTHMQAREARTTGNALLLDRISTTGGLTASAGRGGGTFGMIAAGTNATFASDAAATIGTVRTGAALTVTNGTGTLTIGQATAGTTARFTTAGDSRIDTLAAGQDVTFTGQRDAGFGTLASTGGAVSLTTAGALTATGLSTARALAVTARAAMIGGATAGGDLTATATAGDLSLATLTAAAGKVTASGTASIGGAVNVAGNLAVRAGVITLGTAGATVAQRAGGIALTATGGAITGRGALTLSAGSGGMALTATGTGGAIDLATATALDSGAGLVLETDGTATFGSVTNTGRAITVSAGDIAVNGPVTAGTITLINRTAATLTRLGDAPSDNAAEFGAATTSRFDLSTAEIGRLAGGQVILDAQTGAVTVGNLSLGTGTGGTLFQIRTSGRIDLLGRFVATGSPIARTIVLGGGADINARASVLRVAATSAGGGRLLVDGGTLDLRANAIGVGLDTGFLDAIGVKGTTPALDVATRYVAQASSALYNATLGNSLGLYRDPVTVQAGRMIVRYGGFALFQNTGNSGSTGGVVLGRDGQGQTLELYAAAPANAFAIFGSVNGMASAASPPLGGSTLVLGEQVSHADSRANGCLIGSVGGGCLSTALTQPTLNSFDSSRLDVFRTSEGLTLQFDPLISISYEALFSDIAEIEAEIGADIGMLRLKAPCLPDDKTCFTTGQR